MCVCVVTIQSHVINVHAYTYAQHTHREHLKPFWNHTHTCTANVFVYGFWQTVSCGPKDARTLAHPKVAMVRCSSSGDNDDGGSSRIVYMIHEIRCCRRRSLLKFHLSQTHMANRESVSERKNIQPANQPVSQSVACTENTQTFRSRSILMCVIQTTHVNGSCESESEYATWSHRHRLTYTPDAYE